MEDGIRRFVVRGAGSEWPVPVNKDEMRGSFTAFRMTALVRGGGFGSGWRLWFGVAALVRMAALVWGRVQSVRDDGANGLGFFEEEALCEHAEDVLEGEVGFLDVHGDCRGDDDVVVAEVAHFAAA